MQISTVAFCFFASVSVDGSTARLVVREDVRAAGARRMIGRAAVTDHRHQKRRPRGLEIADDRDAVELAVQDQEADLDPGSADLFEQFADEIGHRQAPRHGRQRNGVAYPLWTT